MPGIFVMTLLRHLSGPGSSARQALAAHFLRDCRHVFEIGGAGLPITDFITHRPESVTVIDPKIEAFEASTLNGHPCRVRHVAAKFQTAGFAVTAGTGLVLLGVSLKAHGSKAALDPALLALARGSRVTILEYALDLERATAQVPDLVSGAGLVAHISIDLTIADGAIDAAGFGARRFLVLAPQ